MKTIRSAYDTLTANEYSRLKGLIPEIRDYWLCSTKAKLDKKLYNLTLEKDLAHYNSEFILRVFKKFPIKEEQGKEFYDALSKYIMEYPSTIKEPITNQERTDLIKKMQNSILRIGDIFTMETLDLYDGKMSYDFTTDSLIIFFYNEINILHNQLSSDMDFIMKLKEKYKELLEEKGD